MNVSRRGGALASLRRTRYSQRQRHRLLLTDRDRPLQYGPTLWQISTENGGFRDNPFQHTPLPASEEGEKLLVGRALEVGKILTRLCSTSKIVALEGRNGIGKTSVYNVAAYKAFTQYLAGEATPPLIPCKTPFQLSHTENIEAFARKVWFAVGLTLVERASWLNEQGIKLKDHQIAQRWLTSPLLGSVQASLQIPQIIGVGGGRGQTTNNSQGFAETGFQDLVKQWLSEIFRDTDGGGVVCCIDNLELLRTSDNARQSVEALRDVLFSTTGLRWIFCGSAGIVYSLVSTPRLNGVINSPIEIDDLPNEVARDVFLSRLAAYELEEGNKNLPLSADDFEFLFRILNGNIRDSLSQTSDYCLWFYETNPDGDRSEIFRDWLNAQARDRLDAVAKLVKARAWRLFDDMVKNGGECAPGEHDKYGLNSPQAMRSHLIKLEASGLIQSLRDEVDNRRKTIVITPMGRMVEYAKSNGLSKLFQEVSTQAESSSDENGEE